MTYSSIDDEPTHVYREVRQCKHYINPARARIMASLPVVKAPSSHAQTAHSIQTPPRTLLSATPQSLGVRIRSCKKESPVSTETVLYTGKIPHRDLSRQLNPARAA